MTTIIHHNARQLRKKYKFVDKKKKKCKKRHYPLRPKIKIVKIIIKISRRYYAPNWVTVKSTIIIVFAK